MAKLVQNMNKWYWERFLRCAFLLEKHIRWFPRFFLRITVILHIVGYWRK